MQHMAFTLFIGPTHPPTRREPSFECIYEKSNRWIVQFRKCGPAIQLKGAGRVVIIQTVGLGLMTSDAWVSSCGQLNSFTRINYNP